MPVKTIPKKRIPSNRHATHQGEKKSGTNDSAADLLKRMDERWSHIPESERARIPADGAMNMDHYLYSNKQVFGR
jgi:hypothetical protein